MLFLAQFKLRQTDDRGHTHVISTMLSGSNTFTRIVEADDKNAVMDILVREYRGKDVFCVEISGVLV
jgi:hypothetical protein